MKYLLLTLAVILSACAGVQAHYDSESGLFQVHAYDNSALNTSSKLSHYSQCDKGKEFPLNCKLIGMYHSDTTGLIPSVGGQALQGAAIAIGLSNSDDNTSVGGTVINNECRGNCGGKGKKPR